MTRRSEIVDLLGAVAAGTVTPEDAVARLAARPFVELGFATIDTHREERQDAPEVVLAEGKTPDQVVAIAVALDRAGASSVLVTRASAEVRAAVRAAIPEAEEHELARAVWVRRRAPEARGCVAIVSGGTSDGSVVHEARIRAELLGVDVRVHEDVGVAGLHRLETALRDIMRADCVVVVAGLDAALASVVGGLAPCPVIGVPTSVGYGSAHGGTTALNAMLASCVDGLAVVGIDDGLGAGTVAARIARGRAA